MGALQISEGPCILDHRMVYKRVQKRVQMGAPKRVQMGAPKSDRKMQTTHINWSATGRHLTTP